MNHYKFYRILSYGLLVNNLAGIILNLALTLMSIVFLGIGIPGIILLFFFLNWSFSPKQRNSLYYTCISLFTIVYNTFICYILDQFHIHTDELKWGISFFPYTFPMINIGLCLILCILSLAESSREPSVLVWPYHPAVPKPLTEPFKTILMFLVAFSILVILMFILVPSLRPSL
jgi:hypothetical protein